MSYERSISTITSNVHMSGRHPRFELNVSQHRAGQDNEDRDRCTIEVGFGTDSTIHSSTYYLDGVEVLAVLDSFEKAIANIRADIVLGLAEAGAMPKHSAYRPGLALPKDARYRKYAHVPVEVPAEVEADV